MNLASLKNIYERYIWAVDTLGTELTPHQAIASVKESQSVKVVQLAQFLPAHERNNLYTAVCKQREAFNTLGPIETNPTPTLYLPTQRIDPCDPKTHLISEAADPLKKRIAAQLPTICEMLGIVTFKAADLPVNLINGFNGHFGNPHADSVNGEHQVSVVYYFHKTPKVFNGGHLAFYEPGHTEPGTHLFEIETEDNLLVAFPSETYHGVTRVESKSSRFEDGRMAAAGFLGARSEY